MQNIAEFHIIGRIGKIDAARDVTHVSVAANYNRRDGNEWKAAGRSLPLATIPVPLRRLKGASVRTFLGLLTAPKLCRVISHCGVSAKDALLETRLVALQPRKGRSPGADPPSIVWGWALHLPPNVFYRE